MGVISAGVSSMSSSTKLAHYTSFLPESHRPVISCLDYCHLESNMADATISTADLVIHRGGCHCKAVQFEVQATKDLTVWDCNCSICSMKRNTHFVVPESRFRLVKGADMLTTYTFNTGVARHQFCKICGVQAFYKPRSNPDGVAVTIHCVDPASLGKVVVKAFDGVDWEAHIGKSGIKSESVIESTSAGSAAAE